MRGSTHTLDDREITLFDFKSFNHTCLRKGRKRAKRGRGDRQKKKEREKGKCLGGSIKKKKGGERKPPLHFQHIH